MLVVGVAAFVGVAPVARTQQPTRLPAVVVNASPEHPGPRKIGGIVRDTAAGPLDSVEVAIVSLQRRVFTKTDGTFLFTDIAPGAYQVRARKIGYAPQIREMAVDSTGGAGTFALMPLAYLLRPVVTTVARGGLSGVVGDTAFNALPGADVDLLGHASRTVTDSAGSFFMAVRPGRYVVRVRDTGFADRLVSVIVPDDSGERIRVNLAPRTHPPPVREARNIDEFGQRLAWRSTIHSRVYTHADLERMQIDWVQEAVQRAFGEIHNGPYGILDRDCAAVVNGGPQIADVEKLTVDDVEAVEIYDVGGSSRGLRRSAIAPVPYSNYERAAVHNYAKPCARVSVWLR